MDRKNIKIIRKIFLLLAFNMIYSHINKDYILPNLIAFVYIFHKKKKFSNFNKLTKSQGLLYKDGFISIKS